jgi:hypothetical protein
MRMMFIVGAIAVASWFGNAADAALLGLNNTGGSGWSVTAPDGSGLKTVDVNNSGWGTQAGSSWITASNLPVFNADLTGNPTGTYVYETSFDLSLPEHLGNIGIGLKLSMLYDNSIKVFLNNAEVFDSLGLSKFSGPATLLDLSGLPGAFDAGVNTLRFEVENVPVFGNNPTGLNVVFLDQDSKFPQVIPEPMSLALWGGLGGFALVGRFRKRRKVD